MRLPMVWIGLALSMVSSVAKSADVVSADISYYSSEALESATEFQKEQCKLDVYHPDSGEKLPTLIWFHGGGLTGGHREFPRLKNQRINLVAAGYRLSPQGEFPCFIEDAAAATAWTIQNISKFGGDPEKVFVGGHSAGG